MQFYKVAINYEKVDVEIQRSNFKAFVGKSRKENLSTIFERKGSHFRKYFMRNLKYFPFSCYRGT